MNPQRIEISLEDQRLSLFEVDRKIASWPISSAARGTGFETDSYRTPTGCFHISEMIGDGCEPGTIFKGREPRGVWHGEATSDDLVTSRILWLAGDEAKNANTKARYIYIHGTNHEARLGSWASCGCIRMSNDDIITLFSQVSAGTPVMITPPTTPRAKLVFFDCDSTLSTIEGIDEMAREAGTAVFEKVEALTNAAMDGKVPLDQVFSKRMEIIQPDETICDIIARKYIATESLGARRLVEAFVGCGWTPIILSGGFARLIRPLADHLGIDHLEAVPLQFDSEGGYAGFDSSYPTTRNGGKPEIIRAWKQAMSAKCSIMIGDGISDLESNTECDLFVGYGGVIERQRVKDEADLWIKHFDEIDPRRVEAIIGLT